MGYKRPTPGFAIAFAGLVLAFFVAGWAALLGQDDAPRLPFDAAGYQKYDLFSANGLDVVAYSLKAKGPRTKGEVQEGRYYFLVSRPQAPGVPESARRGAYRVDAEFPASAKIRLTLSLLDLPDGSGETPDEEPPRVLVRDVGAGRVVYDSARDLLLEVEKARDAWEHHKEFLDEALASEPEKAHAGWTKIAEDLERAHERHPAHLGILKDLIVAYSQLRALEGSSPRGANLALLIPSRIAEFEVRSGGTLQALEAATFRRSLACLYFGIGLYPLAWAEAGKDGDDPDLALVREAMTKLGFQDFELAEELEVPGKAAPYAVRVYRTKGDPANEEMLFPRVTFVTRPKGGSEAPGQVWYTLASQKLARETHYYLYGHAGASKKVLALYGAKCPADGELREKVVQLMTEALGKK